VGAKVWTAFNRERHVLTETHPLYNVLNMERIVKDADCFMAIDPHSKYFPFCGWVALVPRDSRHESFYKVVYNEWPTLESMGDYYSVMRKKAYFDGSLKELAKQIYICDGAAEHGIKIIKRFIDTRFAKGAGGENWSTSTSGIVHEFAKPENGGVVLTMPKETTIDRQRGVIIDAMKCNPMLPIGEFNSPDFYVMPHCKNVIQSLESHRCIEGSEKEDEKFKDPSDMLRILFAGIEGHKYTKEQRKANKYIVRKTGWMG
jgi:hypothetical protein